MGGVAMLDSIVTSGGNVIYAGIRQSDYWGRTAMSTYMTFKTTEDYTSYDTPEYSEKLIFDSLTLHLSPDITSSTECGNLAFESAMQGIYTKIEFPYLNDLRSIADHCSAASAELRIYPKAGTYCKQNYSGKFRRPDIRSLVRRTLVRAQEDRITPCRLSRHVNDSK